MNILITYDLSHGQDQLKTAMKSIGYYDAWETNGTRYNLPASTLWKPNSEVSQGLAEIQNTAKKLGITLTRCIVVPVNPWAGITGTPL